MEAEESKSTEVWLESTRLKKLVNTLNSETQVEKNKIYELLNALENIGFDLKLTEPEDGFHITRYRMYQRISEFFKGGVKAGNILEVSGDKGAIYQMFQGNYESHLSVEYPNEDVQNLSFNDNSFDYVICDQVIEHIENPQKAVDEIFRVLKPGGWVFLATCFLDHIHTQPDNLKDYWRFTPDGIRYLLRNFSGIFQCEGWGNKEAFNVVMYGGLLKYLPIQGNPDLERISSFNDSQYPLSVWGIAQK